MRRNQRMSLGIVAAQEIQRLVGKDDAKAKGGIGRVLFANPDMQCRHGRLQQDGAVKTGRTGANNFNPV